MCPGARDINMDTCLAVQGTNTQGISLGVQATTMDKCLEVLDINMAMFQGARGIRNRACLQDIAKLVILEEEEQHINIINSNLLEQIWLPWQLGLQLDLVGIMQASPHQVLQGQQPPNTALHNNTHTS